jgi:serine/threonine protein kinase/tetratricopeptide (TPR) repeat protein
MGEVYLARDTKLDRKVALKLLPGDLAASQDRMERFVREAKSAAALNHSHIAQVFEIGEHHGTHFIAMEFIDGVTLREKIHRERTELRKLLRFLQQVAEGLSKAHAAGIVHRDLKPDNIMITRDGSAKVLDFGLAKLVEKGGPGLEQSESSSAPTNVMKQHSVPGMVMGTVGYMSPEQAQGKTNEIDQRSDIFSFGCILFEAATGKKPFEGDSVIKSLHSLIYEPAPQIRDLNPSAPAELQRIVGRCLEKDADERYQTIKDVGIELKNLRRGMSDAIEAPAGSSLSSNQQTVLPAGANKRRDSSSGSSLGTDSLNAASTQTSSIEYLVTGIKRHKLAALLSVVVVIAAIGGFAVYHRATTSEARIESIAVMPFVNASNNPDAEYLSDGMTETLISSLSQLPNLNVKPRASVFRYKGKETDPQAIGKELNVQAILNGRVVQRAQDLSLFVELVDVALNKVVWSQQYNRKQSDIVILQTEIARDVSSRLKTKLSGVDEANVTKTYTANPEAYQLFLKGSYYKSKYTEEGYKKAIDYFQKAIEKDPNYALAYSEIAAAYDFASDWYLPPHEAMPKAKAAALKALELDSTLAGAHSNLGIIAFWYEWDWKTSERELLRSMELDPTYSHKEYGLYLTAMGRSEEAIRQDEIAQAYSPLDLLIYFDFAQLYIYAGRYDEAIEKARKAIELDENYSGSHATLGLAYERKRKFPEAIAEMEKAHSLDSNNTWITGYLGYVYAAAGKKAEAQKVLDDLKELSKQRWVSPINIAVIYAGLNDKDQAFEWLNKSFEARALLPLLRVEIAFENLRTDQRFKDLLRRLNLPE